MINHKKKLVFSITFIAVSCAAICASAIALSSFDNGLLDVRAGSGLLKSHTVIYNSVVAGDYDVDDYGYTISFQGEVEDKDGTKYPLNSVDGEYVTFLSCAETYYDEEAEEDKPAVEFNKTVGDKQCFAYFPFSQGEAIFLTFDIIDRATLDLDKSVLDYYVEDGDGKDEYRHAQFYSYDDPDTPDGYVRYCLYDDVYGDYGSPLKFTQIKLVFTCEQ